MVANISIPGQYYGLHVTSDACFPPFSFSVPAENFSHEIIIPGDGKEWCPYCHQRTKDDSIGQCGACGGGRESE
jgi:hypothetical protein